MVQYRYGQAIRFAHSTGLVNCQISSRMMSPVPAPRVIAVPCRWVPCCFPFDEAPIIAMIVIVWALRYLGRPLPHRTGPESGKNLSITRGAIF
jgi:hypothetical protein